MRSNLNHSLIFIYMTNFMANRGYLRQLECRDFLFSIIPKNASWNSFIAIPSLTRNPWPALPVFLHLSLSEITLGLCKQKSIIQIVDTISTLCPSQPMGHPLSSSSSKFCFYTFPNDREKKWLLPEYSASFQATSAQMQPICALLTLWIYLNSDDSLYWLN